jgi:hypothetical protein
MLNKPTHQMVNVGPEHGFNRPILDRGVFKEPNSNE